MGVGGQDVREFVAVDTHFGERVEDVFVASSNSRVDERGLVGVENIHRAVLFGVVHAGIHVVEVSTPFDCEDIADSHAGATRGGVKNLPQNNRILPRGRDTAGEKYP
jgi:hypothetical protein